MPVVLDTNVWLDAAKPCEEIRNERMRRQCEVLREEAKEAIELAKGDCYIPQEVRSEIKRKYPKTAAKAESLIASAGCRPINADEYTVTSFERAAAIIAKRDRTFLNRCTSKQDISRSRNDWRIVAKAADLSERLGEPVIIVSRDKNMCDRYCTEAYNHLIDEFYDEAEVVFVPTPLAKEVIEDGVHNEYNV